MVVKNGGQKLRLSQLSPRC